MTDNKNAPWAPNVGKKLNGQRPTFRVIDNSFGYIVTGYGVKNHALLVLQGTAWTAGAVFLAAAIGLYVMPTVDEDILGNMLRNCAAVIFSALAVYMLWFSSRGSTPEVHVDTQKGEIREAVQNRAGRTTIIKSYGFDEIGGVFIDRSFGGPRDALLVLRYKNTPQTLSIAQGNVEVLERLKDRVGSDLLKGASPAQPTRVTPRRIYAAA
jgi:hypothetical protein